MTTLAAIGFVLLGLTVGFAVACIFTGAGKARLEVALFREEIENARLKRGQ